MGDPIEEGEGGEAGDPGEVGVTGAGAHGGSRGESGGNGEGTGVVGDGGAGACGGVLGIGECGTEDSGDLLWSTELAGLCRDTSPSGWRGEHDGMAGERVWRMGDEGMIGADGLDILGSSIISGGRGSSTRFDSRSSVPPQMLSTAFVTSSW